MSIERLDIYSVRQILSFLPDISCYRLGIVLPKHKTEINNDFKRKTEINIDGVSSKDTNDLLEVIKCCSNLRKVSATKERRGVNFQRVIATIVRYCPQLQELKEVKDPRVADLAVPGINLSTKEVQYLSLCKNLKTLNIRYTFAACTFLKYLYRNNRDLEKVRLHVHVNDTSFITLPNSIKEIEIANSLSTKNLDALIDKSTHWDLEKFSLPRVDLQEDYLAKLESQRMLKSLNIRFSAPISFMEELLLNNSYLEDVTLFSIADIWTTNVLDKLPNTIKRLTLEGPIHLDSTALQRLLQIWEIEYLCLNCRYVDNKECVPELIRAAPTLRELKINSIFVPREIASLEIFKQLKSLKLLNIQSEEIIATGVFISNCVNLEVLHLETTRLSKDSNLFVTIANLPKLLAFQLTDCSVKDYEYYNKLRTDLAKSESLNTLTIRILQNSSKFRGIKTCSLQTFEYHGRHTFMDLL